MNNNLRVWVLKQYISIEQAAVLILDEDPNIYDSAPALIASKPSLEELQGFIVLRDELIQHLISYWKTRPQHEWFLDKSIFMEGDDIDNAKNWVFGFDDIEAELVFDYESLKIKQTAIKEWLKLIGIQSEYFNQHVKKPENIAQAKKTGILKRRRDALEQLINEEGVEKLIPLGRLGVWQKLTGNGSDLFPYRNKTDDTVNGLYKGCNLIKFRKG